MEGIVRHLPNSDTANKVQEQKQNVYFANVVKNSFSCHVLFVVQGLRSLKRYNLKKIRLTIWFFAGVMLHSLL